MDDQNNKTHSRSRVKKSWGVFRFIAPAIIFFLLIGFYFYTHKSLSLLPNNLPQGEELSPNAHQTTQVLPADNGVARPTTELRDNLGSKHPALESPPSNTYSLTDNQKNNSVDDLGAAEEVLGELTISSGTKDRPTQIQHQIDEINSFYIHLDQQPYMQIFMQGVGQRASSKVYFSKLLQKLVDSPPIIVHETDDLFTLLQNTAHFFRILGKDNINILKSILSNEQTTFEHILKTFYDLTSQPAALEKEYSLIIPPRALTDYAAFFLNTMGGRLYLFRRDSNLRMVVSYYAIATIDRANVAGNGGHGIDLRPAIRSLIEEMENGGRHLQARELYLDALYDLQEKYD